MFDSFDRFHGNKQNTLGFQVDMFPVPKPLKPRLIEQMLSHGHYVAIGVRDLC